MAGFLAGGSVVLAAAVVLLGRETSKRSLEEVEHPAPAVYLDGPGRSLFSR